jgi:pimeloyl-ACP methyl ester carboxylesterase
VTPRDRAPRGSTPGALPGATGRAADQSWWHHQYTRTWATDFRDDLPKIDVPILVIQGDADQVLPLDKTGKRLPGLIKDVQLVVVPGGPHAIPWSHADQVNTALLDFLRS